MTCRILRYSILVFSVAAEKFEACPILFVFLFCFVFSSFLLVVSLLLRLNILTEMQLKCWSFRLTFSQLTTCSSSFRKLKFSVMEYLNVVDFCLSFFTLNATLECRKFHSFLQLWKNHQSLLLIGFGNIWNKLSLLLESE